MDGVRRMCETLPARPNLRPSRDNTSITDCLPEGHESVGVAGRTCAASLRPGVIMQPGSLTGERYVVLYVAIPPSEKRTTTQRGT
jgi:hypothetical protein